MSSAWGELSDTIEAMSDNFARAVFDLVVDNKAQAATTAAVQQSNALLAQVGIGWTGWRPSRRRAYAHPAAAP